MTAPHRRILYLRRRLPLRAPLLFRLCWMACAPLLCCGRIGRRRALDCPGLILQQVPPIDCGVFMTCIQIVESGAKVPDFDPLIHSCPFRLLVVGARRSMRSGRG